MELLRASVFLATSLGSCISCRDGSIDWLDAFGVAHDGFDGAMPATLALMIALLVGSILAGRACLCKRSVKKAEPCCIALSSHNVDGRSRACLAENLAKLF